MTTQTFLSQLVIETCCNCHIPFGMTQEFYNACRRDSSKLFYCPNGHNQHYTTGRIQELEKQLENERLYKKWAEDRATAANARATSIERSRRAIKGVLTRTTKRIAAGVCPCCNRSFGNLARHMKGQHPDYVASHQEDPK